MSRVVVRSRVDRDGVLRINLPIGAEDADREVEITVERVASPEDDHAEYVKWLDSIYGSWQGEIDFVPLEPLEERDPF